MCENLKTTYSCDTWPTQDKLVIEDFYHPLVSSFSFVSLFFLLWCIYVWEGCRLRSMLANLFASWFILLKSNTNIRLLTTTTILAFYINGIVFMPWLGMQTDTPVMGMRTQGISHSSSSSSNPPALLSNPPPLPAAPWWFNSPLWELGLNPSKLLTLPAVCSYKKCNHFMYCTMSYCSLLHTHPHPHTVR